MKMDNLSQVSHELRAPLCVIKEGIHLILSGCDGPVTENQRETLMIANRNVERLTELINDITDLNKKE